MTLEVKCAPRVGIAYGPPATTLLTRCLKESKLDCFAEELP